MPLIVVPAKPLARAKQRLATVLDADERRLLCLAMLADVCHASVAAGIGGVIAVASDIDAEAVARAAGASVVRDPLPDAGLNPSLDAAIPRDAGAVLVLASDVAAATPDDVRAACGPEAVVVVTDATGDGTNALWRMPADVIGLAFGEGSAQRHRDAAVAAGATVRVAAIPGLALDIDLPQHLKEAWDAPVGENTRAALRDLGFPDRAVEPPM